MSYVDSVDPATRELTESEQRLIVSARDKAHLLYEGVKTPHRSCGIALAETFGAPTRPYQALRRGGITGQGYCGAIRAGELLLGELAGDPSPTGAVTDSLRAAMIWFQEQVPLRIERGTSPDFICNNLTRPLGDFSGEARKDFCTNLAADVAALAAEALIRFAPQCNLAIKPWAEEQES